MLEDMTLTTWSIMFFMYDGSMVVYDLRDTAIPLPRFRSLVCLPGDQKAEHINKGEVQC